MAVPPQTAGGFAFAFTSPPWVSKTPLVLSTSQVVLSPLGWAEQGGSPRGGRGGLGQSPTEGTWPRAGGWAALGSARHIPASVVGTKTALASLALPAEPAEKL